MRVMWFFVFLLIFSSVYAGVKIRNVEDAINIGLRNNKDLMVKLVEVGIAEANTKSGFADLVLPSITASFRFSTIDPGTLERSVVKVTSIKVVTNVIGGHPTIGFESEERIVTNAFWDNYSLGIGITYRIPYLMPFGLDLTFNTYRLQVKNRELAELQYQKAVNDYVYNVEVAYYNYLFAKEFSKISVEMDKRLEENVRVAEANFKAGIFSDLDLIRARVQLANNKPNLYSSLNNVKLQKMSLLYLLGLDVSKEDEVEIEGSIEDIMRDFSNKTIDFESERLKIVENNFDLRVLRKVIEISEISREISLSANKPTISLFFNYFYELKKTNNMDNERVWMDSWNAGIQLSVPISEWIPISKSYANIESAEHSVEKSKRTYENMLNFILVQFDQLKLKHYEYWENIKAQYANVEQARKSLDIVTTRYRLGSASNLELLDAQLSYQQARVNMLSAWVSYVNTILSVKKLVGDNRWKRYERQD